MSDPHEAGPESVVVPLPAAKREAIRKALLKHYGFRCPRYRSSAVTRLDKAIEPGGAVLEKMYAVALSTSRAQRAL